MTILGLSQEGESYRELYSAIIKVLTAGSHCEPVLYKGNVQLDPLNMAVIRHCFILTWRLLECLPPSADLVLDLIQSSDKELVQVKVILKDK